ncbi:MAG: hypothetical protein EPO06_11960 [Burkholderiaceae bacterium]|nr:MAG: hypothetical protein EPO06_11960 [Burkholderiaceae bacterium]
MRRSALRARPADNHLTRVEWEAVRLTLLVRSGALCEARTPHCLAAPTGLLSHRPDGRVVPCSVHHRVPQGSGGTDDPDAHRYDRLLIFCGDGVAGCHAWVESQRAAAEARGLLLRHAASPEATSALAESTPLELVSGRLVLLDPLGGFYVDHGWRIPTR